MLSNEELWKQIDKYDLNFESFFEKLIKENKWSRSLCRSAIKEYKKFIYLAAISDNRVCPPKIVDKVWHMHLTYTANYWDKFCKGILKKKIHHNPSESSSQAKSKDVEDFEKTKDLYRLEFGHNPPDSVWNRTKGRFRAFTASIVSCLAFVCAFMGFIPFYAAITTLVISFGVINYFNYLENGHTASSNLGLFDFTECGSCSSCSSSDSSDGCSSCGGGCGD